MGQYAVNELSEAFENATLVGSFYNYYPAVLFAEDFDLVVSELVHFNLENNLDTIKKTRTKKLVFTHMNLGKAAVIRGIIDEFSFEVQVAEDNDCFDV